MGTSNLNRGGRRSTEVVVPALRRPCIHVSGSNGTAWSPGARPMLVAPGWYNIHPGTCHSLSYGGGTPSRLQPAGVMSRAVEMARLPRCCVSLKEVWLSHALVALSRAPSRPSRIQFVQAIAECSGPADDTVAP
jgi:hypothetical protein